MNLIFCITSILITFAKCLCSLCIIKDCTIERSGDIKKSSRPIESSRKMIPRDRQNLFDFHLHNIVIFL